MLRRLRLVDFKSFADEAVELAPLTLLVGANASGKSNCLDALRFLHETVFDESIVEILDGERRPGEGLHAWQGLRGGSKEASRIGAESFLIESTWDIPELPEVEISRPISAMHRIRCRTVPRPAWEEEGIYTDDARTLLAARATSQDESGTRRIEWTSPAGSIETAHGLDQSILWTILGSVTPGYPRVITDEAVDAAQALSEGFQRIVELEINPARMRGYGKTNRPEMDFDGGNFSGALWTLCRDPEQKRSLVDWLSEVLAPEIADLFLLVVDRDADEHRAQRARMREAEHPGRLLACLAVEELEVWMLALHRERLPASWEEIRGERDPKERFAHPFLAAHAPKLDAGQGRKWAMRDLGTRWRGLLAVCPELADLKTRIAGALGRS